MVYPWLEAQDSYRLALIDKLHSVRVHGFKHVSPDRVNFVLCATWSDDDIWNDVELQVIVVEFRPDIDVDALFTVFGVLQY